MTERLKAQGWKGLVICLDEVENCCQFHWNQHYPALALCCRYGCVAPDAFLTTISHRPPFCDEKALSEVLDALTEKGILERDAWRDLWLPNEEFHAWQAKGLFWSNIGGQESAIVIGEGKEQPIPLAEIPVQYARGLRPGKIIVLAGKPRLVTRVESQSVWVTDLVHDDAELAKYLAPPEPTPQSVAQAIRTVLTMPDEALRKLPIFYDDWARQRLRWWRQHLGDRLQGWGWITEWWDGRWVLYTFAGSIVNWLLSDLLREMTTASVDVDAWRISCPHKIPLERVLKGLNVGVLERIVEKRWRDYLRRLALPPLFDSLPEHLKQQEVFSVLDLPQVMETLERLMG